MNTNQAQKNNATQKGIGLKAKLAELVNPLSAPVNNWMTMLSLREQVLVKVLAFVIAVYVAWSVGVTPALNSLNKSAIKAQLLEREWTQLLQIQGELKTIKSVAQINPSDASTALQELTAQLGPQCKVVVQDSTARMQIKGVSPDALSQLFPQIRSRSQAQVIEASLKQESQTKLWEGSITLAMPSFNSNLN